MEITVPEAPRLAPIIDLMEALQKSLAAKKPPVRAEEAQAAAEEAPGARKRAARRV